MKMKNKNNGLVGAGLLSAIAASLCCITPVLALISGASGIASTFSWMEPARPYLIGITVAVLGFAWYQKLKPQTDEEIQCNCEENGKKPFIQTKTFLGIVTIFAILMLAFPYYSHIFYPEVKSNVVIADPANIQQANFEIAGMTCLGCEEHIKNAVSKLPGFISAEVNHKTGKATVKFDKSKTSLEQIVSAINSTGYKVTKQEIKN